jgi:site-specific recombinase
MRHVVQLLVIQLVTRAVGAGVGVAVAVQFERGRQLAQRFPALQSEQTEHGNPLYLINANVCRSYA